KMQQLLLPLKMLVPGRIRCTCIIQIHAGRPQNIPESLENASKGVIVNKPAVPIGRNIGINIKFVYFFYIRSKTIMRFACPAETNTLSPSGEMAGPIKTERCTPESVE
ncbi:MAG: hypothetical protein ACPLXM_10160, partial [Bacteroidales bacterium]